MLIQIRIRLFTLIRIRLFTSMPVRIRFFILMWVRIRLFMLMRNRNSGSANWKHRHKFKKFVLTVESKRLFYDNTFLKACFRKDCTRTVRTYIIIHLREQHVSVFHASCFNKENRSKFFITKRKLCVACLSAILDSFYTITTSVVSHSILGHSVLFISMFASTA